MNHLQGENRMRKLLALAVCGVLAFGAAACGDDEEVPVCKKAGVDYKEIQVANDGISVVTNKDLKVDCLTVDQLKKIWNEGSKVKNLTAVDPKLPDAELSLF